LGKNTGEGTVHARRLRREGKKNLVQNGKGGVGGRFKRLKIKSNRGEK